MSLSLPRQVGRRVQALTHHMTPIERPVCAVAPEAVALLAEILARLHDVETPLVQFVAACPAGGGRVARDFAVAAVARLGRTLLLSSQNGEADATASPMRTVTLMSGGADTIVPDTSIPGLYYRHVSEPSGQAIQTGALDTQPFRMIVIVSATPSLSPAALTCARYCHGSIIMVAAGVTRLQALQTTARQIRHAGGTVLGTVLFDAPRVRLPFGLGRAA